MNKEQAEKTIRQILAGLSLPMQKHQELQAIMDLLVMPVNPKPNGGEVVKQMLEQVKKAPAQDQSAG